MYRIRWIPAPKRLKERAPVSTRIMMLTWPVWVPLFFLGLGLYVICALAVLLVKLAWDLLLLLARMPTEREKRYYAAVDEWQRRNELERREAWMRNPLSGEERVAVNLELPPRSE